MRPFTKLERLDGITSVSFYQADGTTPYSPINIAGESLQSTLNVGTDKRFSEQPFLNIDSVYYEATLVNGGTIHGYDTRDEYIVNLAGVDCPVISTVTALRNFPTALEEGDIVALEGYNSAGDKPVVFYNYHSTYSTSDNGGSVIQNSTGYFVMATPTEDVDMRHFGIFPSDTKATALGQSYASQMSACNTYAKLNGKKMFSLAGWYSYNAGSWDINGAGTFIVNANNLIVHVNTDSTSVKFFAESTHKPTLTITCKEFHSTQNLMGEFTSFMNVTCDKYIMDSDAYALVSNAKVYVTTTQNNGGYFTDCQMCIASNASPFRGASSYTFIRCNVNPYWTDYATGSVLYTACTSRREYWNNDSEYVTFCKNNEDTAHGYNNLYALSLEVDNASLFKNNLGVTGNITTGGNITANGSVSAVNATFTGNAIVNGKFLNTGNIIECDGHVSIQQPGGYTQEFVENVTHVLVWNNSLPVGTILTIVHKAGRSHTGIFLSGDAQSQAQSHAIGDWVWNIGTPQGLNCVEQYIHSDATHWLPVGKDLSDSNPWQYNTL